jgi:hypothetical protein
MECTSAPVDDLQRRRNFTVKHFIISTQPKRPNNGKRSHPYKRSKPIINTVQPIAKDVGHTAWGIKVRYYLDDWPYRPCESTLEKKMFNSLIMVTENTTFVPMPILFGKIIFGENNSTKIPTKHLSLKWYLHLQNHLVIINWCIKMN